MNYRPRELLSKDANQLKVQVKEVMDKSFITVQVGEFMESATSKILNSKQSGAPVIGGDRQLLGFLSTGDCLRPSTYTRYFNSIESTVEEHMTKKVEVISEDSSLFEVIQVYMEKRYHTYPVVNKMNQVVGLLTRTKVLQYVTSINQTSWFSMNYPGTLVP